MAQVGQSPAGAALMDDQAKVRPRLSRRAFLQALVVGNAVALAACQAPATAPASSRAAGASTPGAASGPATRTADTATGWEQQWNDWIASAQQGGKLVLAGPPNPDLR